MKMYWEEPIVWLPASLKRESEPKDVTIFYLCVQFYFKTKTTFNTIVVSAALLFAVPSPVSQWHRWIFHLEDLNASNFF